MRVILETRTGPQAGRKIWLKRGQVVQVGSTEDADFVIPDDLDMAGVHFSLRTDHQGCVLTDLETEAGTIVNGEKVQSIELTDGDQIQAGNTILLVRIDGARPAEDNGAVASSTSASSGVSQPIPTLVRSPRPASPVRPAPPASSQAAATRIACSEERCGSGLTMFESSSGEVSPSALAQKLAERWQAYLVADLTKLKLPLPADVEVPRYVLDWLDAPLQSEYSPVMLHSEATAEFSQLLDQGWGQDGLVCMFASLDPAAMLSQLQLAAAYNPSTGVQSERETMLAYWWPNISRLVLTHSPPGNVRQLLGEIHAVLLEGPEPGSWQLFGRPAWMDELRRCDWLEVVEPVDSSEAPDDADLNVSADETPEATEES